MGAFATIPLMGQQPQILNPLQLAQSRMTLQQLANQNAISKQLQQENELKIQAQQRDAQDQDTFRNIMKQNTTVGDDGMPKIDWDKAIAQGYSSGMLMKNIQGIENDHRLAVQSGLNVDKEKMEAAAVKNQDIGRNAAYLAGIKDPTARLQAWADSVRPGLIARGSIDPNDPAYQNPDLSDDNLQNIMQRAAYLDTWTKQVRDAAEAKKDQEAARAAGRQNDLAELQQKIQTVPVLPDGTLQPQAVAALQNAYKDSGITVPTTKDERDLFIRSTIPSKDLPDYDIKTNEANYFSKMTPDDWSKHLDLTIPPTDTFSTDLNQQTKNRLAAAPTWKEKQKILDEAEKQLIEQRKSISVAQQTAPIKIGVNLAELQNQNKTMMGAPGNTDIHGADYLATLPAGLQGTVKAIAEGRQSPPRYTSRGPGQQIMNAVNIYDPSWSEQRAQIRKDFTTGADGRNIGSLNTAVQHLDQLADAADALKNGTFQPGNASYQYFSRIFGKNPPTNFEALRAAVAGEMASALKGAATDSEIKTLEGNINKAQSPEQLKGFVDTNLHILGQKLNTYNERYNQQVPGGDKFWSPILPSTEKVYVKHGIVPGQLSPDAMPDGGGKVIDKDTAKKFYDAAGGDPNKTRDLIKSHNWKLQ